MTKSTKELIQLIRNYFKKPARRPFLIEMAVQTNPTWYRISLDADQEKHIMDFNLN